MQSKQFLLNPNDFWQNSGLSVPDKVDNFIGDLMGGRGNRYIFNAQRDEEDFFLKIFTKFNIPTLATGYTCRCIPMPPRQTEFGCQLKYPPTP